MFWADRTSKLAGIALLVLVPFTVASAILTAIVEEDAFLVSRGDVEGFLVDVNDNETVYALGTALDIVNDTVLLVAMAALVFLVFRDRSQVLATLFLVGFLVAAAAFVTADAAQFTLLLLAADFVEEGGAGSIVAGDPTILQTARAAGAFSVLSDMAGITSLAFGLLALSALILTAPQGAVNPPRWLGGLGAVSSVLLALLWTAFANDDVGFSLSGLGIIGSMVFLLVLGGWLLMSPEPERGIGEARPAAV